MKHLLRFLFVLVLLAAAAAVIARLRARLAVPAVLGAPETPPTAPPAEAAAPLAAKPDPADPNPAQDDLADIWGIGPVYRGRLAAVGIASFRTLAAADPEQVAETAGVPAERAADWISQAAARLGR